MFEGNCDKLIHPVMAGSILARAGQSVIYRWVDMSARAVSG